MRQMVFAALFAALLPSAALAQGPPSDAELAEALDTCKHNRQDPTKPMPFDPTKPLPPGYPLYAPEWASCLEIDEAQIRRQAPKIRADTQKQIQDLAKRLK